MLEELDVWEGEEEEAAAGLRWHSREPSRACSDRYGAGRQTQELAAAFTRTDVGLR